MMRDVIKKALVGWLWSCCFFGGFFCGNGRILCHLLAGEKRSGDCDEFFCQQGSSVRHI